eukprot:4747044-Amphidinium_carterae.1
MHLHTAKDVLCRMGMLQFRVIITFVWGREFSVGAALRTLSGFHVTSTIALWFQFQSDFDLIKTAKSRAAMIPHPSCSTCDLVVWRTCPIAEGLVGMVLLCREWQAASGP